MQPGQPGLPGTPELQRPPKAREDQHGTGGSAAVLVKAAPGRGSPPVFGILAHTRQWPSACCQSRGQDTREKAEWEGPGFLSSSPEMFSLRPELAQLALRPALHQ